MQFELLPLGDRAIVLRLAQNKGTEGWRAMAAAAAIVEREASSWIVDAVPAYDTLTVIYDPLRLLAMANQLDEESAYQMAERLLSELIGSRTGKDDWDREQPLQAIQIPVCYGGEYGPDLEEAAERSGLSARQFIEHHAAAPYTVAMIGFMPGFPYLSGLPEELTQPRKAVPRAAVPAGSVGIAGGQTGIYPQSTPGGWQLIGRTSVKLYDIDREPPVLLKAGDHVHFVPVDRLEEEDEAAAAGSLIAEKQLGPDGGIQAPFVSIKRPGMWTAIQHTGEAGLRAYGIPAGGAMDRYALRVANLLAGNEPSAAGLELTLAGPELVFGADQLIAICGAPMSPTIDGEELPMWRPLWVRSGAVLRFGHASSGCRAYVAAAGGLEARRASIGRRLAAGDRVPMQGGAELSRWAAAWAAALAEKAGSRNWAAASWFAQPSVYGGGASEDGIVLRAMPGSEYGQFSEAARELFFRERYRVAPASNRMGCRLEGTPLERTVRAELLSHGVTPGTVQVPQGGAPIVLAADCQTTGGYPKIAHVATADMPLLAQARPGDWLTFKRITLEEAQLLDLEVERELKLLTASIRSRLPRN
ncbi:5-oxoprolinase subunit PxpB [Paenibacillus gorillae]|uniref:5-oxoprolinase subunit PxpB n=1 Tax=Paenibacillus gorillae TaxID=1243662 RepID=UPI0004B75945|nr:5-oxoprolinase subunit PxpB [Paenibacillus gorillae]